MGLQPIVIAACLVGGYLLGSIPFGVIATRLGGVGDVRKVGSGNIGATNVLRTGRKDLALITLLGDGGKGFATFLGVLLAAAWPVGLLACATWLLVAGVARISSLSALTAAALCPIYVLVLHQNPVAKVYLAVVLAVMIFVRHSANIARLLKGQEPRIGAGKEK